MRRKIVPATAKSLARTGLRCKDCIRWESLSDKGDVSYKQKLKAEHMSRMIKEWGECGKIVYVDKDALAYAQYGPAKFWPGIERFPSGPISEDAVFLACLCVLPFAQGRGLGRVLLQAIESGMVKRKVRAIETFTTRDSDCPLGPIEFYLQNGFYIVRDDPHFPLLRLELKTLVGWQINIQFALDKLKIPARPANAPAHSSV
ncbi:MAG: GNAT family N-acetyltransferase [Firmicutes bacterium]|nr:GNAT family N-acetyltransferase [Bacillota bacterium]